MKSANLALRFLLELAALGGLGYWGFHNHQGALARWGLGLGVPALAAVIWGTFVAPKASYPVSAPIHLALEVLVLGAGAVALYVAGRPGLAGVYGLLAVVNKILMTVWHQ